LSQEGGDDLLHGAPLGRSERFALGNSPTRFQLCFRNVSSKIRVHGNASRRD